MRLHNTLSRKVEEFTPKKSDFVTLYTCGPTVYNYYHIGNLRNAVFNDTLRRTLEAASYKVRHVMNVTDVGHLVSDADEGEDKLEKGARREGKTVWQVANHYTDAFKRDMSALGVLPPSRDPGKPGNLEHHDSYARATDFIPEQIQLVQALVDKGFAYVTKQAIYFEVSKLPDYGELSGQKLADKETARDEVVSDPDKHSQHDFAVWFFAVGHFEDHSMQWKSPWGSGFPGWHLECSAIIHASLGDPIDIHTGGIDHIGTHHPNEMAQTEAAYGHPLAKYWVHNEFMLVDGVKMAKSKGNSYTLGDITSRGFEPLALRLLYLQAHYRSELNFTWQSLEAAQNALLNLAGWSVQRFQSEPTMNELPEVVLDAVYNDLGTPGALAALAEIQQSSVPSLELLQKLDDLFGLKLASHSDISAVQKQVIAERETARNEKDWGKSDKLRDELAREHIEVEDTPTGPRWRRSKL